MKAVKGTIEHGKRNHEERIYHQKKIIEQYGQVNMKSELRNQLMIFFYICE
jgi:hypothetical protein